MRNLAIIRRGRIYPARGTLRYYDVFGLATYHGASRTPPPYKSKCRFFDKIRAGREGPPAVRYGKNQRWIRPEPSPPASFSTSETETMLKSPSMECFRAEAATANSMASWVLLPVSRL